MAKKAKKKPATKKKAPPAPRSTDSPRIQCIPTGIACKIGGKIGQYWKCGSKTVCVPNSIRGSIRVTIGKRVKITARSAVIEFTGANGKASRIKSHSLCDCASGSSTSGTIPDQDRAAK